MPTYRVYGKLTVILVVDKRVIGLPPSQFGRPILSHPEDKKELQGEPC